MAAQYYNISEQEMDEFLTNQGFKRIQGLPNTVELVYGKRVDQDDQQLTLRVYTGITHGESRNVGEDAIRVNLFMRSNNGGIVKLGGSKRVHRVMNWKKNLQARIDGWLDYMPTHKCKKCGMPMVVREGSKGKFLGCVGYPNCKFTLSV